MFKIQQTVINGTVTDRYSLHCYIFDVNSHSYKEIWIMNNLKEKDLALALQKSTGKQLDADFGFVILKSGNGPVIFAADGEVRAAPVKVEVPIKESTNVSRSRVSGKKPVLSGKRRKPLSH